LDENNSKFEHIGVWMVYLEIHVIATIGYLGFFMGNGFG
jgi:hypothetical protein